MGKSTASNQGGVKPAPVIAPVMGGRKASVGSSVVPPVVPAGIKGTGKGAH